MYEFIGGCAYLFPLAAEELDNRFFGHLQGHPEHGRHLQRQRR